jgi:Sulfotransferase family
MNVLPRKPNFFIIGAPKCGTTSLWSWLSGHPNIFMAPEKEPHFFNTDDLRRGVTSLGRYEALFHHAREEHKAIGEASVWYLSSCMAVRNILQYQPTGRFIVMVRNPIEMAPALHGEMLVSGLESVVDFRKAWHLQDQRRHGRRLPGFSSWAQRRFLYGDVCCLGEQLERLISAVSRAQVLVVILDDVRADPRREYLRVLDFLDLPDDGRLNFAIHNPSKSLRIASLRHLYRFAALKRSAGIEGGLGLWGRIQAANEVALPRAPLPPEILRELRIFFRKDVERLGLLLDRDLTTWLS